ncbi:MAG: autotransporter outer membrane beta-barrel domain-containing protein [Psychroflexus sp.]|jgi:outer membrane protein|nr:autotransporter outer membrane beta-barrel domain-containing protein [Psychroflexus sp.]MDR9448167.1 autotransporter outer membrane beta-barrel domain-containing protein [Psychroflexus sp.]
MKNLFLTFVLLFSINASAQYDDARPTEKGQFLVNGGLTFNASKIDSPESAIEDISRFNFSISPRAGYFVIDRLAIGLEASFFFSRQKTEYIDGPPQFGNLNGNEDQINTTTSYSAGPFVRYYLKNGIFAEAGVAFAKQNSEVDNYLGPLELESEFFSYEVGAGYAIFFNNSVSLEPFLSYQFERQTQNENETTISGLNLGVGFTYYFKVVDFTKQF